MAFARHLAMEPTLDMTRVPVAHQLMGDIPGEVRHAGLRLGPVKADDAVGEHRKPVSSSGDGLQQGSQARAEALRLAHSLFGSMLVK